MKKFITLLLFSFLMSSFQCAIADDDIDFWDAPMKVDQEAKSQQKAVTDQEFEKVLNMFKKKKKDKKKKNQGAPIGPALQEEQTPPDANAFKQTYEDYPTVMVPVTLITDDGTELSPGYYRILSVKKDDGYFLNFYQGNSLLAKIRAFETGNDYEQKSVNYTKVIPVGEDMMNIIYGDIDCNIEASVLIKN